MGSGELIPDKQRLIGLVEAAYKGKICLPNFQREFVWTREQVADLLRSILRRYYIGSLLLLRCEPQNPPFAPMVLRGAKCDYAQPRPELLILDGQQRMTSLIYALAAPDLGLKYSAQRRWFFIDLVKLMENPDDDEIVLDRATKELNGLLEPESQYRNRVLPCTKLMRTDDFMAWRDGLGDWIEANEPQHVQEYKEKWRGAWTKAVSAFQDFDIPLIELPRVEESDTQAIGRVCAIFEKLNSTGVELSVYDLLTARLYRHGIRLHDLWNRACETHKRLADWSKKKADTNKFGVLILRTIALLRGLDPKPSILIDLDPHGFKEDWEKATAAMDRALELITEVGEDGFGVFMPKYIPGFGMLPVLAALRAVIDDRELGEVPRAELRRWYWCNVFLERYSSAVESKSRRDYSELTKHWLENGPEPSVFTEAQARIGAEGYSIATSASHASMIYCGVFCLLAIRGARDWALAETIKLQKLNDHHIVPKNYLKERGFSKKQQAPQINTILNRTLISNKTNNRIKAKAPADYLAHDGVFPSGPHDGLMSAHFISPKAVEVLSGIRADLPDDAVAQKYEDFRRLREEAIVAEIRRACGVHVKETAGLEGSTERRGATDVHYGTRD